MSPFMLDTSAINRILDDEVENEWPMRGDILVTDIQLQEILETPDTVRRNFLFQGLLNLHPNVIRPSEMAMWYDGSGDDFDTGGRFPWTVPEVSFTSVPLAYGRVVPVIGRRLSANPKRMKNRLRDGYMAEAALLGGMTLVTADHKLANEVRKLGGYVELIV
jgi:hypothetical protein